MERLRRAVVPLLLAAFMATVLAPTIASAGEEADASLVVVVLSPYMTWDDVRSGQLPNLEALAENAAIGNLNTRSRATGARRGSLPAAALMLSAGSWAVDDPGAPGAYNVEEHYDTGDVAEAYERFMGDDPGDASIAYLGFPRAERANDFDTLDVELGSFGQAISDAGGLTVAIGNSDAGYATSETGRSRPAALASMDASGLVGVGDVSRQLLQPDDAPYGLSTDRVQFAERLDEALAVMMADGDPGLMVLDPGDGHRATMFAEFVSPEVAEAHRIQALDTLDHIVGLAAEALPDDGVLIVATVVPVLAESGPDGFGPCIVAGDGWDGYLTSSSTQQDGLATLSDVPATALAVLGLERPVAWLGNPMSSRAGGALDERVDALIEMDQAAVTVDLVRAPVLNSFIVLAVLAIVVSTLFVVRRRYPGWLRTSLQLALLLSLSVPVASYLMFAVDLLPSEVASLVLTLVATSLVVWLAAFAIDRTGRSSRALLGVSVFTGVVLMADAWIGSPLSELGTLSYSPLQGARYYGMGNEAAGILFGSLLVGIALLMDEHADASWMPGFTRWGLPIVGIVAVWTAASPSLGANVGVAAWGIVAFAVMWLASNGVRMSWRRGLLAAVAVVLLVGIAVAALSLIDIGGGTETHLARALDSAERGGLEELWVIVARKAETNLRVLTHTNWAYVLLAVLALLAFMRWKPRGEFMEALERYPAFADAMTALLIGGLVAYFTEDSGIVIPALMLLYPGAGVLYLMLGHEHEEVR